MYGLNYKTMKNKVGRKKISPLDKQVAVQFYTKLKVVEEHGGMENVRLLVKEFIEKAVSNERK